MGCAQQEEGARTAGDNETSASSSAEAVDGLAEEFVGPFQIEAYQTKIKSGNRDSKFGSLKPGALKDVVLSKSKNDPQAGTISFSLYNQPAAKIAENKTVEPRCSLTFAAASSREEAAVNALAAIKATGKCTVNGVEFSAFLTGDAAKKENKTYWEFRVLLKNDKSQMNVLFTARPAY